MIIIVDTDRFTGIEISCMPSPLVLLHRGTKENVSRWNLVGTDGRRLGYGAIYQWTYHDGFQSVDETDVTTVVAAAGGEARYSVDVRYGIREDGRKKILWFTIDAVSEDIDGALSWIDGFLKSRFIGKQMAEWHEFGPGTPQRSELNFEWGGALIGRASDADIYLYEQEEKIA